MLKPISKPIFVIYYFAITEKRMEKNLKIDEMYYLFENTSFHELEDCIMNAQTRRERAFYRKLINLKLQLSQEDVIGETLV